MKKSSVVVLSLVFTIFMCLRAYAGDISKEYETMLNYGKQGDALSAYMTAQKIIGKLEKQPELLKDLLRYYEGSVYFLTMYSTGKLYLDAMYLLQGYMNGNSNQLNGYVWGANYDNGKIKNSAEYLKILYNSKPVKLGNSSSEFENCARYGKLLRGMYDVLYKLVKFDYPNFYRPYTYKWNWDAWSKNKSWEEKHATFNSQVETYLERLYYYLESSHNEWQVAIGVYAKDRTVMKSTETRLNSILGVLFDDDFITAKERQELKNDISNGCSWGKELDDELAYYLFDCPIAALTGMVFHVQNGEDKWFSHKMEEQVESCGRYYSTLVGGVIFYSTLQNTRDFYLLVGKYFKKILNNKEYEQLKTITTFQINAVNGIDERQMVRWP